MKIFNNHLVVFSFSILFFSSSLAIGQESISDFYIPYWEKSYKVEAAMTINQVEQFKAIEDDFSLQSHLIKEEQLFWEEEEVLLNELAAQKWEQQMALVSEKQIEIAKDYVEDYRKNRNIIAVSDDNALEDRASTNLENFDWTNMLQEAQMVLEEYYLAERANIRAKLEQQLTPNEREVLTELRKENEIYLSERLEEYNAERTNFASYEEGLSALNHMVFENLMNDFAVQDFLKSNPANYYAAKELAVKYDGVIDELFQEFLLLEFSTYQKFSPSAPNTLEMPPMEYYEEVLRNSSLSTSVDIGRNVMFLLWGGEKATGTASDRAVHSATIFPVPAVDYQTVQFELENDGNVTIDVISADGKRLDEVFYGTLQAGMHRQEVNIQSIRADVFFYRIMSEEGISIVKSIKVN